MMRIELDYEASLQYFDCDPVTLDDIVDHPDVITEIDISDHHVMYRYDVPDKIGTATWVDDDYRGAVEKLMCMGMICDD